MKKILLTMTAIAGLSVAAPGSAQYANHNVNAGGSVGIGQRIAQLDARLQAGIRAGVIDRSEARSLRLQMRQLTRLEQQYSYNGLTRAERTDLQQRLRTLREEIRRADGGRYDRDNRYGDWSDDRYDDDRYGRNDRIDNNRDGWDDRDHDRDGRWDDDDDDDDRYGRRDDRIDSDRDGWDDRDRDRDGRWDDDQYDDRYEQPAQRGGIGGIIDRVLGTGGLRVGQRASGNLRPVPYEYRNRFRDGNGVYYRSDGRQIYQIDARNDTVLRIYAMNR